MNRGRQTITDITRQYVDIFKTYQANDQTATYFNRYSQNIVDNAEDWYLAVDRFNIPINSVPLMIFNPTTNYYSVELCYNGIYSGEFPVVYVPSTTYPTNDHKYYYINAYDDFINMVNTALSDAFTYLGGLVILPLGSIAPYFMVNQDIGMLSYVAQVDFYDEVLPTTNRIDTYINKNLYQYLRGPIVKYDTNTLTNRVARYISMDLHNNTLIGTPSDFYIMKSNLGSQTLIDWNVARGLVLMTNCIPINQEYMPTNISGSNTSSTSSLLNNQGVLSTFDFIYTQTEMQPTKAQYILNSVYKLIDLRGSVPVNTIDLSVFWYDNYNILHPLDLEKDNSLSIRLVFIKKGTEKQ